MEIIWIPLKAKGIKPNSRLTATKINHWHRILVEIRSQCILAGEFLTFHQIFSVGLLIYYLSSGLYVVANSFRNETNPGTVQIVTTFCFISSCRLICKVYFAGLIPNEVIIQLSIS